MMTDFREDLERKSQRFELDPGALDRLFERRRRKQRDRRIAAGVLGLVVAVVTTAGLVYAFQQIGPRVPASPSGAFIVFSRQDPGTDIDDLYAVGVTGSDARKAVRIGVGDFLSVSPDGTRILSALFDLGSPPAFQWVKPVVAKLDGSDRTVLPVTDPDLRGLVPTDWSPDGSRFVAEGVQDSEPALVGIYTARSTDGGDLVQLTATPPGGKDRPVGGYSPDGSRILFIRPVKAFGGQEASQNLFVISDDGTGLVRLNPPGTTTGWDEASWSPDGQMVTFVAARGQFLEVPRAIFVVGADGSDPRRITPWGDIDGAEWSPDGRWIAFSRVGTAGHDLYLVHPDGRDVTAITSSADGLASSGPEWSPDGTKLLFARSPTAFPRTTIGGPFDADLWIVNADGTGLVQITQHPAEYYVYAWAGPIETT